MKWYNNYKKVSLEANNLENNKSLMAIHNLNEDKLNDVLDLGGIPYPSIAISKPSTIRHEGYGIISLLFNISIDFQRKSLRLIQIKQKRLEIQ